MSTVVKLIRVYLIVVGDVDLFVWLINYYSRAPIVKLKLSRLINITFHCIFMLF